MNIWKWHTWKWYAKQALKNPAYRISKIDDRYEKARAFKKKWGFHYEDTWNLDDTLATFLYPRLAFLRDNHYGHPTFENLEPKDWDNEWIRILDTMTRGFYLYSKKEDYEWTDDETKLWEETKKLFIQYYSTLWD